MWNNPIWRHVASSPASAGAVASRERPSAAVHGEDTRGAPPATSISSCHLFILGGDYHLGDLLWFTTVLRTYRRQVKPTCVIVNVPDRGISRILEGTPLIDELVYGSAEAAREAVRERAGRHLVVHDLRMVPIGLDMVRRRRERAPWRYYRDLWLEPRGQWLATYLGLGEMDDFRPILHLSDADRAVARDLPSRYVIMAPHVGHYSIPLMGWAWSHIKGWPTGRWVGLAAQLREQGYEPLTLGAAGQEPIPGTRGLIGLPIRQVAGVIERASALVTVESGLWFIAAAVSTPFVIVRWWLPRSVDWPGPTGVPHARIYRGQDSVAEVLGRLNGLVAHDRG